VVFTPLLQSVFLDKSISKLNKWTWLSAIFSIFGSYLLAGCANKSAPTIGTGEVLTIISAAIWAMSIIVSDIGSKFIDGVDLVIASSIVSSVLYVYAAFMMEPDTMTNLSRVMSGYTWQLVVWVSLLKTLGSVFGTVGQRYTSGYQAAIIMGLDTVVTMIIGYFFLSERLNNLEKLGGFILLLASFLTCVEDLIVNMKISCLTDYVAYLKSASLRRMS
jgi:drug/metabolite transporter (DMT)-like permease